MLRHLNQLPGSFREMLLEVNRSLLQLYISHIEYIRHLPVHPFTDPEVTLMNDLFASTYMRRIGMMDMHAPAIIIWVSAAADVP
ncbi:hypothetical protein D3C72_2227090 [compost metagenome]